MKTVLTLTLGALLACPIFANAQSTTTGDGGGGGEHHGPPGMKFLTSDERAELKKAHDAAVAANPDLAKQDEALHEKMKAAHESGNPPDPSLMEQGKTLHEQMDAAMVKADPNVAPILAKLKAHHHEHGGPGGPGGGTPPPAPSDSGT